VGRLAPVRAAALGLARPIRASLIRTTMILACLILLAGAAPAAMAGQAVVRAADVETVGEATWIEVLLSRGVTAEVFTLADPFRVVIDLPDTGFSLPEGTGARPAGLIKGFRYGLFAPGKGRIVIDTVAPVVVSTAEMVPAEGSAIAFRIELRKTDRAAFGQGTGAHLRRAGLPLPRGKRPN